MDIYVLGDQNADCQAFLRKIFLRKENVLLTSFLDRVCVVLREEVSRQSFPQHGSSYPGFSTVQELVERYHEEHRPNLAIESAIVCLSQLTNFIDYLENHPMEYLPSPSHIDPEARLLGICVGLIAASAIACADSLRALLPLAVEAIRVAFRVGAHVGNVSDRLETRHNALKSWSTMLSAENEKSVNAELERFHEQNGIPASNRVWVSVVSATHVAISGPPSVRKRLFETKKYFQKAHQVEIPVWGAYHAPHLYSVADIEKILVPQSRDIFGRSKIHLIVHSSADGRQINASTPLELLEKCLQSILINPVRWDKLLNEVTSGSLAPVDTNCKVHTIGPTNLASKVVSALRHSGNFQVSMEDHTTWRLRQSAVSRATGKKADSKIAIVGMAGRFPDAADHDLLWKLLEKGLDVHREVPKDRYNVVTHTDPTSNRKNTSLTPYGCFIEDPGLFDARFFHMSPREAAQTDPMQRLTLATAYEAMEMAGIVSGRTPSTMPDRIGTFYGQTSDDWREINAAQDIDKYFISGGVRAFGPGRVNYFFKFSGPSFIVDTACSSSFAAIQLACTSLRAGDCDTAFTGGANVLTNPDIFSGLSRGHFLSKTGSCKTFDNDADGYCRGDGVATVILKRLEDAMMDKDPILGVILGSATNHSAEAVSITHPHAGTQQSLFFKVLQESGVDAHDVSYVEMHGTGTQAGDRVEMQSVSNTFAPTHRQRSPDQPLYLGAIKANIGHGEAASGVCALIKTLLMLRENAIPPHCGIKGTMNKNFPTDLRERNVNIALKTTPFLRPVDGSRTIFLNNFSAAGGNTALLLEDGPEKRILNASDPRSTHIIAVSAKSLSSFRKNIQRFQSYVQGNLNVHLPSLSYTSTARRSHYNYRAAFAATDINTVNHALANMKDDSPQPISTVAPRIAFVFTGQGSQYPAIGKEFFDTSRVFRLAIEEFQEVASCQGFPSILSLVDGSVKDIGNLSPVVIQLGMVSIQMALVRLWASWGIKANVVIGHSLGEYAALNAAGVLSVADTIFLVGKRAMQLESKCTVNTHAMLAIKGRVSSIRDALRLNSMEVACINGEMETVLSGTVLEMDSIAEKLTRHGFQCKKLKIPYAFHSSQVDSILESFEELANAATFHAPEVPVISPILGEVISDHGVFNPKYLRKHARNTVDFLGSLTVAVMKGVIDTKVAWIEIGSHPVCSGMIKSVLSTSALVVPSLRREQDAWKTAANSLCALYSAGVPLKWSAYHDEYTSLLELVDLPTYAFDNKVYWIDYINDWTLTKGDFSKPVAVIERPALYTTSIHRIISERIQGNVATVVAESDFADPLLHSLVSGHLINGAGLCPSSLYADMALTLAYYAYKQLQTESKTTDMNVGSMTCPNPLFLKNVSMPENQLVQVEVNVDLAVHQAEVVISSTANNGKTRIVHAKCTVDFEDASRWLVEWQRHAFLVRSRIDILEQKINEGKAHLILRGMAYKLFSSLVEYGDKFRGMKEVILDSAALEATAQIEFQTGPQDGNFFTSPYFIDIIGHLSGFVMNANDGVDSKTQVYISHGWESMRFAKPLEIGKKYRTWVKMQPAADKMVAGDVYLFDEEKCLVGVLGGLRFQCIPRKLFNTFLPTPNPSFETTPRQKPPIQPLITPKKHVEARQQIPITVNEVRLNGSSINGLPTKALNIVAAELGVELSELADNINFTDFGVDSLMFLAISGRFREELNLEVQDSLFIEVPTVKHLKLFLSQNGADTASEGSFDESEVLEDINGTPNTILTASLRRNSRKTFAGTTSPQPESDEHQIMNIIRSTIAHEMDIDIEEIADTTDLSAIGLDSLMSLTILGVLRERTALSIEPNLFIENSTMEDIRKALDLDPKPTIGQTQNLPKALQKLTNAPAFPPAATSVLLQGNPRTATRKLFLFPDGSGSATSYVSIPPISPSKLCVYGLNCPYMKDPTSYTCGVDGVSAMYIKELLRRQPEGPYLLGGWSAGGVVAFEVSRQLTEMGRVKSGKNYSVERLILIDAPCPVRLEPLPSRLHHFMNSIGLLGAGNPSDIPDWLLPHFEYSVKNLSAYKPELMNINFKMPMTLLIWACDGVCKNPEDPRPPPQEDDPKSMNWLLNNRTDFGYNGWDQLLDPQRCTCVSVSGNHFTMMRPPIAQELGELIKEGLEI